MREEKRDKLDNKIDQLGDLRKLWTQAVHEKEERKGQQKIQAELDAMREAQQKVQAERDALGEALANSRCEVSAMKAVQLLGPVIEQVRDAHACGMVFLEFGKSAMERKDLIIGQSTLPATQGDFLISTAVGPLQRRTRKAHPPILVHMRATATASFKVSTTPSGLSFALNAA